MLKNVLKLCWVSIILLLASCAHKQLQMPSYEGRDIREVLALKNAVSGIETRFSVLFVKNDSEMRGDGALDITRDGDMSLRIYSLGFLSMELTSNDGEVKSSPRIDKTKTVLLTQGLRDCLFWWDIQDFIMQEDPDSYRLRNSAREIWINKSTLLPDKQTIYFDDGRVLTIFYDEPVAENGTWYQSRIRIELARYSLTLHIKNMTLKSPA